MWNTKKFKSRKAFETWRRLRGHKYQWAMVYLNNVPYAVEFKKIRVIG